MSRTLALSSDPISDATTSRREFLWQFGGGLGGIALASLLAEEQAGRRVCSITRRRRSGWCSSS